MPFFVDWFPQCCDATAYLALGDDCAVTGECWSELRPMGAVYWFSVASLLCMIGERADFYLGSYAMRTYLQAKDERVYSCAMLCCRHSCGRWR